MKADRKNILDKCNGRCAYCGSVLGKRWHIDHVLPVNRQMKYSESHYRHKTTKQKVSYKELPNQWFTEYEHITSKLVLDKVLNPERDTVENSLPACHSCNITKSNSSVDDFRKYIEQTVDSLNRNHNATYKFAKRYGQVQETPKPVIFYFETLTPNLP